MGGNGSHAVVGDEIFYSLTIQNNGTVTLSSITPVNTRVRTWSFAQLTVYVATARLMLATKT